MVELDMKGVFPFSLIVYVAIGIRNSLIFTFPSFRFSALIFCLAFQVDCSIHNKAILFARHFFDVLYFLVFVKII